MATETTVEVLAAEAERGNRLLNRLELLEAEDAFRNILQRLPEDRRSSETAERLILSSLVGLAEIHAKHCRSVRERELEWMRSMFFSLLLYKEAMSLSSKIVSQKKMDKPKSTTAASSSSLGSNDNFYSEILIRSKTQANGIEVLLVTVLKERIVENCARNRFPRRKKANFEDSWLENLWNFCGRSAAEYNTSPIGTIAQDAFIYGITRDQRPARTQRHLNRPRPSSAVLDFSNHLPPGSPDTASRGSTSPMSCGSPALARRKINFDRFQVAIKQFVSEVSTDIRSKYVHIAGKIPHGLLEQRVSSELAVRLSPGSIDNKELSRVFQLVLANENQEDAEAAAAALQEAVSDTTIDSKVSSDENSEEEDNVETIDLHITPCAIYSLEPENKVSPLTPCNQLVPIGPTTSVSTTALVPSNYIGRPKSPLPRPSRSPTPLSLPSAPANESINNAEKQIAIRKGLNLPIPDASSAATENRTKQSNANNGVMTTWRGISDGTRTSARPRPRPWSVGGFEELSQFTEKREKLSPYSSFDPESATILTEFINESKLSQLLGHTSMLIADSFRQERKLIEACQLYKYAFGIFTAYPVDQESTGLQAKLLVDIGVTSCSCGELEIGSQLLKEAADMYENSNEILQVGEVWYQLGNAYLEDNLRQESLVARVMQLTKEEVVQVGQETQNTTDNNDDDDDSDRSSNSEDDSYYSCIYEAIVCYQRALEVLDGMKEGQTAEIYANVLSNLADCHVMTGRLDKAESFYEETLRLFNNTFGSDLLEKNAHVLTMLGMLSFLTGNHVRAATMNETSYVLRIHCADDPSLEMAWSLTILGFSYFTLRHYHKCITWCIRAFKLYTRFFRGRLLFVDPLNRWFILQNLYILGFAYTTLNLHKKALYYLNFCINLTVDSEDQDIDQLVRVLLVLGDTHSALDEIESALKYYKESWENCAKLKNGTRTTVLKNQVWSRLTGRRIVNSHLDADSLKQQQALLYQQDMESSIKGDMVAILLKLGMNYQPQNDMDWAVGCYDECVQGYRALNESHEAARALASLGTMCYVKSRMRQDRVDDQKISNFLKKAEKYFQEAFDMVDSTSPVCIQFGNYLYGEGRSSEALLVLLPFIFCSRPEEIEIAYNGIEQMALPQHLHYHIEEDETLVFEARVLAKFLGVLCFRCMRMTCDADDALVELYRTVVRSERAINYTLLGYALLEMGLIEEATESFFTSSRLQRKSKLTQRTTWMCMLLSTYIVLGKGIKILLDAAFQVLRATRRRGVRQFPRGTRHSSNRLSSSSSFQDGWRNLRVENTSSTRGKPATNFQDMNLFSDQAGFGRTSGQDGFRTSNANEQSAFLSSSSTGQTSPQINSQRTPFSIRTGAKQSPDESMYTRFDDMAPENAQNRSWKQDSNKYLQQQAENVRRSDDASIISEDGCAYAAENQLQEEGLKSGTKKKWRSKLYHNLPEIPKEGLTEMKEDGTTNSGIGLSESKTARQQSSNYRPF